MSEEVKGASINVARSMVFSVILNGVLAFGMLLAVLFCAGDIKSLLGATGYPFITIFASGVGSNSGASAMASLPLILTGLAAIGNMAAASRMMWAFARNEGLPGWRFLSRVCLHGLHLDTAAYASYAAKRQWSLLDRSPYYCSYYPNYRYVYYVWTSMPYRHRFLYGLERRYLFSDPRILYLVFPSY